MAVVVHSLTSTDGRLRVEVVRRPTGGYQLSYSRYREERVPEYGFAWEGWVSVPGRVTLADTAERGATLAAEALALWERQEGEPGAAVNQSGGSSSDES
jgi:hypothetical protein